MTRKTVSRNVNFYSAMKNIRFPHQLLEDIAKVQGDLSFAAWVIDACSLKLSGGVTPEISLHETAERLESVAQFLEKMQINGLSTIESGLERKHQDKPV